MDIIIIPAKAFLFLHIISRIYALYTKWLQASTNSSHKIVREYSSTQLD